jgi:hypothetical protein
MFSKNLTKHFKGFGCGFTKLHAKLDAATFSILPSFAVKGKHEVEKVLVSKQYVFTAQCHVAD